VKWRLEKIAYLAASGLLLLAKIFSGDKIKEDEVGGACGACGREAKYLRFIDGEP
jgi:hypothetical protein